MLRNLERQKNEDWLGTIVDKSYEWMSWNNVAETSKSIGFGLKALNLVPDMQVDGETWRFIGIKAQNRKEWNMIHLGNMQ